MARFGQIISLMILASMGVVLYRLHINKKSPFDLTDLFIDHETHRIDGSMFRMNLAFLVTSWVIIYVTLNSTVSEWLYMGYLGAWVIDRKFSRDAKIATPLVIKDPIADELK